MNGRFQPGRSGNPGGSPRAAHSIQELARKHTIEALDVLVQIMLNEKAPPNARVAAANTLLDRAYGKAPTFSTSDTQAFKRAIDMTDDELAAIVAGATPIVSCQRPCRGTIRLLSHSKVRLRRPEFAALTFFLFSAVAGGASNNPCASRLSSGALF